MKTDNAYAELNAEDTQALNEWIDRYEKNELADPDWYDLYLYRDFDEDSQVVFNYADRNGI